MPLSNDLEFQEIVKKIEPNFLLNLIIDRSLADIYDEEAPNDLPKVAIIGRNIEMLYPDTIKHGLQATANAVEQLQKMADDRRGVLQALSTPEEATPQQEAEMAISKHKRAFLNQLVNHLSKAPLQPGRTFEQEIAQLDDFVEQNLPFRQLQQLQEQLSRLTAYKLRLEDTLDNIKEIAPQLPTVDDSIDPKIIEAFFDSSENLKKAQAQISQLENLLDPIELNQRLIRQTARLGQMYGAQSIIVKFLTFLATQDNEHLFIQMLINATESERRDGILFDHYQNLRAQQQELEQKVSSRIKAPSDLSDSLHFIQASIKDSSASKEEQFIDSRNLYDGQYFRDLIIAILVLQAELTSQSLDPQVQAFIETQNKEVYLPHLEVLLNDFLAGKLSESEIAAPLQQALASFEIEPFTPEKIAQLNATAQTVEPNILKDIQAQLAGLVEMNKASQQQVAALTAQVNQLSQTVTELKQENKQLKEMVRQPRPSHPESEHQPSTLAASSRLFRST